MQHLFMQIYTVKHKLLLIASICMLRALPSGAQTPAWAKEAIWYQIFPDRFRNGDPSNDPTLADIKGCWPHNDTAAWEIMPWTSDWYAMQPWELANGQDFNYNVQRRRYGGDLQGIIDRLGYIDSLGINAIYLNPVFWAPSLHKYDAVMYHHVDPNFGPDPEGDKKLIASEDPINPATWHWTAADKLALQLINSCHKRGIKIIFDGVFNHMGINSFAFQDVVKNQQDSKYKDWFTIYSWDDSLAGTTFKYQGWFGVPDLPEIKEDSMGIVAGPKQYIFDCTKRWMAPDGNAANGIDGWRLDVAFCVDHDFWKSWRLWVKSINPEAYLTAEVIDKKEVVAPYLQGDEFDAVMNYGFGVIASEFFINKQSRISVTTFDSLLADLRQAYRPDFTYVMQNLYDSHDTQRFTSFLHNPDIARFHTWGEYFNATKSTNLAYNVGKPTEEEYKRQMLMALFQYAYVGAPMLYYGDEVGMWGANDPDCRKPMVWQDMNYQPEQKLSSQEVRTPVDTVEVNTELLDYYRKLGKLRNMFDVLQTGDYQTIIADNKSGVYVFARSNNNLTVYVVLNNSAKEQKVKLNMPGMRYYYQPLESEITKIKKANVALTIPAVSGTVVFPFTLDECVNVTPEMMGK